MIRFLVRWAFRAFVVLLVLAIALVLLKDVLLKALVEYEVHAQSGMEARIGKLELALSSPTLTLEDCKVFNPAEFGGSPFLVMPELHIEYDPASFLRRRVHLYLVRLAISEINVVEARNGRTNIVLALDGLQPETSFASGQPESVLGFSLAGIDTVNLSLGKVKYSSLRRPGKSTEVRLDLKNGIFTNVRSVQELANVVVKNLFRNGITIVSDPPSERRSAKPQQRAPAQ